MARHRPDAEETLNVITGLGLAIAFFLAMATLNFFDWGGKRQSWDFWLLAVLTILFGAAHVVIKWWPHAVRLAQIVWPTFVVLSVALLWRKPFLLPVIVVVPIAISIKPWRVGDRLAAYLKGSLDDASDLPRTDPLSGDACLVCGERGCEIVAPQWCFSLSTRQ